MTKKEFKQVLERKGYSYKIEGDKIVVTYRGDVDLSLLTSLPSGVVFNNEGHVDLESLTNIPPGVEFNNLGGVYLESLTSLPTGVGFKNDGDVNLESLTSISPGVVFKNRGSVDLNSLLGGNGYFRRWKGNIKGIGQNRLLNAMISLGLFER